MTDRATSETAHVAIVGAGVAGCAAAYALRNADAEVTVVERRREAGGRAATRRREGCVYDVGANYLTVEDEAVQELVDGPLADELVAVEGDVWTVDADGEIAPGNDTDQPKWTGREGVARLGGALLERSDAEVAWGVDVAGVRRTDEHRWQLQTGPNADAAATATATDATVDAATESPDHLDLTEPFDDVLLTPPAPATAELLLETPVADELRRAARSIEYRPITTVAAHYDRPVEWPSYAIVDVSKTRDLGWVAREKCKPGHVPEGESLVVIQASPEWSRARRGVDDERIADAATDRLAQLLDDAALADPDWTDVVRWRYALTDDGLAAGVREEPAAAGLHVAGDWVAGEARLNAALRSGLATARELLESA